MPRKNTTEPIATIGIDIGKNTIHLIGLDRKGAIVMQTKLSRSQLGRRLANVPCCLIGMEGCSRAHHIGRMLEALGTKRRSDAVGRTFCCLKVERTLWRQALIDAIEPSLTSSRTVPT